MIEAVPPVMWSMESALRAYEAVCDLVEGPAALASDDPEARVARAVLLQMAGHMPVRREPRTGHSQDLARPVFVPAHAVCLGGCIDEVRQAPAPWPCPGVSHLVAALADGPSDG